MIEDFINACDTIPENTPSTEVSTTCLEIPRSFPNFSSIDLDNHKFTIP
jgi:hypothetical protein